MLEFSSYTNYLLESNQAGQKLEAKIAKNVQKWLEEGGLAGKFKASHYQSSKSLKEDDGRDEDYSDVLVQSLEDPGQKIFIECKEAKANFVTLQFDINEDGTITPVAGKARRELDASEDSPARRLASLIQESEQFQSFLEFLEAGNDFLRGCKPKDFWFSKKQVDDGILSDLMARYNKFLKTGWAEADCKPFDKKLVREKTRNILACGLCWRLGDPSRTWDICSIDGIDFFSDLIKQHYASKRMPAQYIQVDDNLLVLDASCNPLGIECTALPQDLVGRFDLKFTPRFGTGSMYVTPRSKLLSKLESSSSFKSRSRWPHLENK